MRASGGGRGGGGGRAVVGDPISRSSMTSPSAISTTALASAGSATMAAQGLRRRDGAGGKR